VEGSDPFGRVKEGRGPFGLSGLHIATIAVVVGAVAIIAVVALSKGGGGGGGHKAKPKQPVAATQGPQPRETLAQFEERLQAAVASPSCAGYRALNRYYPPSCAEVKRRFAGLRFLSAERYGTGAVVDASAPIQPKGVTFSLALGPDRRWKIINAYDTKQRTAETRVKDQIPFDEAAGAWLDAVRTRNCDDYVHYAEIEVEGNVSSQQICDLDFNDAKIAPSALFKDAAAQPELLGGNAVFQFYGLRLKGGAYGTIAVDYFADRRDQKALVAGPVYLSS
jgi:hypothetical protein